MMKRALLCCLPLIAFAIAPISAHADRDAVQFGQDIHVTAGNPVHDAVCFFCSVYVEGEASHDIVVFFGSTHLNGTAHHDVVNFFGDITAADNSAISGDMVSFFGSVSLGENSRARHFLDLGGRSSPPPSIQGCSWRHEN